MVTLVSLVVQDVIHLENEEDVQIDYVAIAIKV